MLIMLALMTEHLGFYVNDIGRLMRKRFDGAAKQLGVTGSQWRVLFMLHRTPGINQGQIAERLEVEPITTCRMIDRLEQAGLVERRRDPTDRRAWQIFLTDAADPLLTQLGLVAEDMRSQSLQGFSIREVEQLQEMLDRLRNNLIDDYSTDLDPAAKKEVLNG
ncbi:Transcriptional regulator SlyA [Sphingobium sp. CECT 9361]|nr:Transcriptional regulator SlyA [Sphingobium sp. CECT 9361]